MITSSVTRTCGRPLALPNRLGWALAVPAPADVEEFSPALQGGFVGSSATNCHEGFRLRGEYIQALADFNQAFRVHLVFGGDKRRLRELHQVSRSAWEQYLCHREAHGCRCRQAASAAA